MNSGETVPARELGFNSGEYTSKENLQGMVRKDNRMLRATGNHTYLTITLRVMLVGDFVKSFLTLYIYILSLKGYFYTKQAIGCLSNTIISI